MPVPPLVTIKGALRDRADRSAVSMGSSPSAITAAAT
jgi:hypothetical protein